jgi:pimeloyl-ACP methyl ester carboxylesterase
MKKPLLFLLLLLPIFSFSQRTIPYPIILVHGLNGGSSTWDTFKGFLNNTAGLSIESTDLSFCLNSDNNLSTSVKATDVKEYGSVTIGNNDVYTINFNTCKTSNESAIAKQGYALKYAIGRVLAATGAKKVILLGHSMGGLASREYLQNDSNWQDNDKYHHVAKLVTIGTPHGGSDLGSGGLNISSVFKDPLDELGEAVRDLKNSYADSKYYDSAVFLFGGYESRKTITSSIFGASKFYNVDIDCNGREGDAIIGLNKKGLDGNVAFSCVIGGPSITDGVVLSSRQNLNNYYVVNAEIFKYECPLPLVNCHTNEPKKALFEMFYALDEPDIETHEYEVGFDKNYKGFTTTQSNKNSYDDDVYYFNVPSKGIITLNSSMYAESSGRISLKAPNGTITSISGSNSNRIFNAPTSGKYRIIFSGYFEGISPYNFNLSFCNTLDTPYLTTNNALTFCEGGTAMLNISSGFDKYQWYKDGVATGNGTTQLQVSQKGSYTVDAYKCNIANRSSNTAQVNVNPNAPKPFISTEEKPLLFSLKSNVTQNINWVLNGSLLAGATNPTLVPSKSGNYAIIAFQSNGCNSYNDENIFVPQQPQVSALTNSVFCAGDSVKLVANFDLNTYRWYRDSTKLSVTKKEIFVKESGIYRAVIQVDKGLSIPSAPITVKVKPNPAKPSITNDIKPEQFTLTSNSAVNNQWYFNNAIIPAANKQSFVPEQVGNYFVRVSNDGCFTNSDVIKISIDKPKIEIVGKNPSCEGDSIILKTSKGFGSYRWSIGKQSLNSSDNEILVKNTSQVSLNVGRGKVYSPQSDTLKIVVNPLPNKPIITLLDNLEMPTLKSSNEMGNQWFLTGKSINNATDQFLKSLTYGEYSVTTSQLGCSNGSESFKITVLDDFTFSEKVKIYPNPSDGGFKVEVPFSNVTNFSIYGINGIEYLTDAVGSFNRGKEMNLNLPSGTYILRIRADGKEVIRKISITR